MQNRYFILFFLIWGMCTLANSADVPAKSEGDLLFYFDTAGFRARNHQTSQEFYYQIPLSEVEFQPTPSGRLLDTLSVLFGLNSATGEKLVTEQWILPLQAADQQAIEGRFLPDFFEMSLNVGAYTVMLEIKDKNSSQTGQAILNFAVHSFPDSTLSLSDIQFSSLIERQDSPDKFIKNSLKVIPNANRVFGKTLPMLYFYVEFYNLSPADTGGTYTVFYEILDPDSNIVKSFPSKIKKKTLPNGLEASAVNIAALKDAGCFLKIRIRDNDTGIEADALRGFWNKSPEVVISRVNIENNVSRQITQMSEKEIGIHYRQLKYIMPSNQSKIYDRLPPEARTAFLISFWNSLDPDVETADNEFWDEFYTRVNYANTHYTSGFQKGWQSDCGRILIQYGIPNEIRKESLRTRGKPYEEWFYNIEGGIRFIFVDEEGFGSFRLIYSSENTEFTDPNWQLILNRE